MPARPKRLQSQRPTGSRAPGSESRPKFGLRPPATEPPAAAPPVSRLTRSASSSWKKQVRASGPRGLARRVPRLWPAAAQARTQTVSDAAAGTLRLSAAGSPARRKDSDAASGGSPGPRCPPGPGQWSLRRNLRVRSESDGLSPSVPGSSRCSGGFSYSTGSCGFGTDDAGGCGPPAAELRSFQPEPEPQAERGSVTVTFLGGGRPGPGHAMTGDLTASSVTASECQ